MFILQLPHRTQFARWSLHMFANQTPAFGANIRKLVKLRMMESMDGFTVQMHDKRSRIPEFFDLNKQYYEYEANSGSLNFEVCLHPDRTVGSFNNMVAKRPIMLEKTWSLRN